MSLSCAPRSLATALSSSAVSGSGGKACASFRDRRLRPQKSRCTSASSDSVRCWRRRAHSRSARSDRTADRRSRPSACRRHPCDPRLEGPMRRRNFISLAGGAAAWPLAARAQQPGKSPTIGFLGATTPTIWSPFVGAFLQRLRELGWIDGRDIAIEYRWAEGRDDRYAAFAAEFVQRRVDVIVTAGTTPTMSVKKATSTIPIVFASA